MQPIAGKPAPTGMLHTTTPVGAGLPAIEREAVASTFLALVQKCQKAHLLRIGRRLTTLQLYPAQLPSCP
ncbi:hypothetical protein EMIT053CA3_60199 [Pseudomonas donghuensis]